MSGGERERSDREQVDRERGDREQVDRERSDREPVDRARLDPRDRERRILEQRARELARPPAPLVASRASALALWVGSDRVLLPAAAALAIAPLTHVTPIPYAEPHVAGLAARRGRAIPVFHLRVLLGLPVVDLPETSRIVVLATEGEPALLADAVGEHDWPAPDEILPAPETMSAAARRLVHGVTADGLLVLDEVELLSGPSLWIDVGPRTPRRGRE